MNVDGGREGPRISALQRAAERRLANPLLVRVLRSPLHGLASRWLALVSYVGERSGRRYTFPVAYVRVDGAVVAVTPRRESNWWRHFRTPATCTVWLRGTARAATGEVVTGEDRDPLLVAYVDAHGLLGRMLGFDPAASPERVAAADRDLAVVLFALADASEADAAVSR